MIKCKYCGKKLRIEKAEEIDRYFRRIRKVKIYYCFNEDCESIPYFYKESKIEINGYDLEEIKD